MNDLADASAVRCLDADASEAMIRHIDVTRKEGDSIGGVFEVIASGLPPGLGFLCPLRSQIRCPSGDGNDVN